MRDSFKPAIRVFSVMLTITGLSTATLLLPLRVGQAASLSGGGSLPAAKYLASTAAGAKTEAQVREAYGKAGVYFEANRGQVDSRANFIARGAGYSLFLTPTEAVYVLTPQEERGGDGKTGRRGDEPRGFKEIGNAGELSEAAPVTKYALRMKIEGASAATIVAGTEELPGRVNYFRGNDPQQWQTNVPTYARVQYTNVYPGIDLVYYGVEHQLEYDFVVAPGVDAHQVSLKFEGADRIEMDGAGDLLLHAGSGVIKQQRPSVYQEVNGERRAVQSNYVLKGGDRVGFAVGAYDRARPLIIDPTVLAYSTYLGAGGSDVGAAIAVDAAGNTYVTGDTDSDLFPTTAGAFQTTNRGFQDAFVTKLNAAGTALIYSTYLGGDSADVGLGIAVDASGNAYVTGYTQSNGVSPFPTTPGAFQTNHNGGTFDAFVTKLNATGAALVYSSYLGGGGSDIGSSVAVDAAGNAYVAGYIQSGAGFPTTGGAFQTISGGGAEAFVTKLSATGATLSYSSYLGGASNDRALGIAVNAAGNAYVTGITSSSGASPAGFPTTPGAFQTTSGGGGDAFVTMMNVTGTALVYSTYLGGAGTDEGHGIAVDAASNAYLAGQTNSNSAVPPAFPTTGGAFQTTISGGNDAFVTKLNATGAGLVYSTYLGGANFDRGNGIAVDAAGSAYVTGLTDPNAGFPFPTTAGAFQTTSGGNDDAFLTKLNAAGAALVYSTYLGGGGEDQGNGVALDTAGNAYVAGSTTSSNYPVTDPAFQSNPSGGSISEAFVSKLGNYSISGRVIDSVGNALGNVQVSLSGARSKVTYTDLQGYFAFENTSVTGAAGDYNVVPARNGMAFTPTIQNISDFSHNVELYFTGFAGTPTGGGGGMLGFVSHSFSASKTDGSATIIVMRLGGDNLADPVTIDYLTSDGTASERSDYIPSSGTLQFGLGEVIKTFNVLINNNGYVEGTRTVNLILENPSNGARLSNQTAVLEIHDTNTIEPSLNPSDDAQFFVRQQYYDFLDRTPDADGLAYWTNQITSCGADQTCVNRKRREVSAAFFVEQEFQQTGYFVYLMNKSSFAEQPGYPRFSRDRARVTGGSGLEASKRALAEQWVTRQDFLTRYPLVMTEDNYVDALNLNAGAVLTAAERAALIGGLSNRTETRATVLRKIADNAVFHQHEYNAAFVLMQYFGYLRREVDRNGYDFWLDVLNNRTPGNFQGMVCAFVTSTEYQGRFGSLHTHSNTECGQ